jgi:XTP/dITP diphosphohydrolase
LNRSRLVIATRNHGKIAEIKEFLSGLPVEVIGLEDLAIKVPECEEKGSSFEENSRSKAEYWCCHTGLATLADDSGLCVDALDGAPGIYSARFSGSGADDRKNIERLLTLLEGVREAKRGASFQCSLTLCCPGKPLVTFQGSCRGLILKEPSGTSGFGYDPVFYYPPLERSFAQLTPWEKNKVSHRAMAFQKLRAWLVENPL